MCMKYVNVNVNCYNSITQDINGQIVSYNGLSDNILSLLDETGRQYIGPFVIVINLNIIGTNDENKKKENVLEQGEKLDFKLRLTKCSAEESERICLDLDEFTVDLKDKTFSHMACFPYLTYSRVIPISKLCLDNKAGKGSYVIKTLVKKCGQSDDDYAIQSMTSLKIL